MKYLEQSLAHSESQYMLIIICEVLRIKKWTRKHHPCPEEIYNIAENRVCELFRCYKNKEEGPPT